MTILNEAGTPDVLSPLHAVNALAERLPDAMVALIGTRAETHLVQTLAAALDGPAARNSRVVFVVLDPEAPPEPGRLASRLISAAAGLRGIGMVLLLAARSAAALGVDADSEARLVARRLELPVRAVDLSQDPRSPGCLSTDLEDRALAAMVRMCPEIPARLVEHGPPAPKRGGLLGGFLRRGREDREGWRRPVVLLGASAGTVRELAATLELAGTEVSGSVPGEGAADLPAVGEGTVVAVVDPYLTETARAADERGARVVRTLSPIGVDGTARFIQDVSAAAGTGTSEVGRARAVWEGLEHLRNRIRGKRIFFAGDTGLEIPLARFLADAGAVVLEVGAPQLDRRSLAIEIQALGADVDVVESPDWRGQLKRADEARPDVVISSPGLYVPLVARGHLCRSSLDFLNLGVHGYEGARRVLELLTRTFDRAEALDSLNL